MHYVISWHEQIHPSHFAELLEKTPVDVSHEIFVRENKTMYFFFIIQMIFKFGLQHTSPATASSDDAGHEGK